MLIRCKHCNGIFIEEDLAKRYVNGPDDSEEENQCPKCGGQDFQSLDIDRELH